MSAAEDLLAALRNHDRDRFLAALFVPEPARADHVAFAAFNWEIARIRDLVSEPLLGEIRFQWWRDALDGIFAGSPREHPVCEALARAVARSRLSRSPFDRLIEARARDLSARPLTDPADLDAFAEATTAPLIELSLAALGGSSEKAPADAAREVGIAYGLARILWSLAYDRSNGRDPLPAERFSLPDIVERAEAHLAAARRLRAEVPKALRPALLLALLAEERLEEFSKRGFDPSSLSPPNRPRPLRPLRLAWAAWRGRY